MLDIQAPDWNTLKTALPVPVLEQYPYVASLTIYDRSVQEIGRLEWPEGKFRFVGDMEESARLFFDCVLKPLVDEYIERRLRGEKE